MERKTTYYLYIFADIDGIEQMRAALQYSYFKLEKDTWSDDDGANGRYGVSDSTIKFFPTLLGLEEELMEGTISDGVLTIRIVDTEYIYCMEGKTPSKENSNS